MAWTDADEARYQQLGQQLGYIPTPPPQPQPLGPLGRIGEGLANVPSNIGQGLLAGGTSILNVGRADDAQLTAPQVPRPYDIPPPTNFSQRAADVLPGLLSTVGTALLPGGLATKGLSLLGAGPAAAAIGGSALAGSFIGLPSGQGTNLGAQFGAQDLLMKAPLPWQLKALGMAGIPLLGEALSGRDPLSQESLVNAGASAIVPALLGHYADSQQPQSLLQPAPDATSGQTSPSPEPQSPSPEGPTPSEPGIDPSITAYHGTPHEVDQFTTDKMGTGEGFQSYGWGLYFAEHPGVAQSYATKLGVPSPESADAWSNLVSSIKGNDPDYLGFDSAGQAAASLAVHPDPASAWEDISPQTMEAVSRYRATRGNLYGVSLDVEPDELIDHDKPLSQQPDAVKSLLSGPLADSQYFQDRYGTDPDGKHLFDLAQGVHGGNLLDTEGGFQKGELPGRTAQWLSDNGVQGIRYLDAGSRDADAGTRNYVVFDPDRIQITHRNGEEIYSSTPDASLDAGQNSESPSDRPSVAQAFRDVASQYPGVDFRVHDNESQAPELAGRINPNLHYEGLNDAKNGVQYGFTDNVASPSRAREVAVHEIVGHYGVDKILKPEDWQGIQDHVMQEGGLIRDDIAKTYGGDQNRIAREYVARLAENTNLDPTLWQKVTAAVRSALRAAGIRRDWSDAEIQDLIRSAHRNLKKGEPTLTRGGFTAAPPEQSGQTGMEAARRKPLTPQEQDEYRGLKKQNAVSPDLLTSTQKTRMSLLEKAMPKESAPSGVEQPVREAYNLLKAKSGMPAVAISDLARESGKPMEEVKSLLQRGHEQGKVVLSSGDWSVSSPEKRAGAIDTPAQKGNLLARFNSEEAIDPSLPRRLDEEAAKSERGRGGFIGIASRWAETNLGLSATPESKLAQEKASGFQQLLTKQVNETSEALRKAKDALPKGRSLFTPSENDALHEFQTSKGAPADIAKFKAAGIPKVGEDYGLAHKAAQQAAGENRAQAEGGQRAAAIEKNLTYTRRAYELLSNPALYAKKFARGDYDAKLDDVVKLWLQKPGFTNLDAETMRQHWEQYLTDLRTGTDFKQGSGSEKISQSLYTAKKDLTDSQWDTMKGLERDSRLNPAQQALVQDAVKNEHLTPTIREQLDKLSDDQRFSDGERKELAAIASQETVPPEVRAVLGEYTDPVERIAFTTAKSLRSVRQTETLNQIADSKLASGKPLTFETVDDWQKARNAATGDQLRELLRYKQLPDQDGFGKLAGRMAHVSVRDALNDINQGMEAGGDAFWGKIQKVLKLNATVLNPATHAHWWMQMPLMFAMARVYNPADWLSAGKIVFNPDHPLHDELIRNNIVGAGSQKDLGLNAQKIATPAGEDTAFENIKTKGDKALQFFGKLYGRPDDIIRTAAYLKAKGDALKAGMSEQGAQDAAITYTNRYTFNYGATPRFTKWASNVPGLNPFLSYSSELTRITKNLAQDVLTGFPGDRVHGALNLALMAAVPLAASLGSSTANLSPQDQLEWDRMRKLEDVERRGAIKFVLGRDQKTGRFSYVDVSPFIPAGDTFSISRDILRGDWKAFAADQPAIGLSHSPIASLAIDLSTGKNNATGQGLFTPGDYAQRIGQSILPPLTPGVGSQAQRIARGFTPNQNGGLGLENPRTGRIDTPLTSLLGVAGIRAQSEQPGSLLKAVQSDAQNERESARAQFLQVAGTKANPDAQQSALLKYQGRLNDINQELMKRIHP